MLFRSASHAIGDIEALLEASGISGEDENGATGFDEKIRQLVIAALAGMDMDVATRQAVESIDKAKSIMEHEEESINAMLGGMEGTGFVGPRAPTLPGVVRSMKPRDFTLAAFKSLGARVTPQPHNLYLAEENGGREHIRFEESAGAGTRSTLYAPGTAGFLRLVGRVIAIGVHEVQDLDQDPAKESEELARRWVLTFGGTPKEVEVEVVRRCFEGTALVRVRATVAHDSYERLVEVSCSPTEHHVRQTDQGWDPCLAQLRIPLPLASTSKVWPTRLNWTRRSPNSPASTWKDGRRRCRPQAAISGKRRSWRMSSRPALK